MPSKNPKENVLAAWVHANVAPIASLLVFVASLFAGFFWVENRYAKAADLQQLERRFEFQIKSDVLDRTQQRIWTLEDRLRTRPDDVTSKEELRKLKEEKLRLDREIDELKKRAP